MALPATAQQPDLRVRIFSLQRITAATVTPAPEASMSRCPASTPACRAIPLTSPLSLRAEGAKVVAAGSAHTVVILKGKLKIEPASGAVAETDAVSPGGVQSRTWSTPLEVSARAGQLLFIARMGLEDYTAAAVQGETAGEMPPEALKAMAVTARSYATHFRGRHQRQGFELCDNTHCQRLRGEVTAAVRAAVEATRGQLLWHRGTPAAAYHHKDCGGRTESAEHAWPDMDAGAQVKSASTASTADALLGMKQSPKGSYRPAASYLASHDDPYCVRASHGWKAEITRADLEHSLAAAGIRLPPGWEHIAVARRTPSGRVAALSFAGSSGAGTVVSASSLRFAVGRALGWGLLKSDWYEIARAGSLFIFSGRGFGHGVGLCQTGAIEMAKAGKSYQEILAFYFPGTALGVSAQGIEWEKFSAGSFDVLAARDPLGNSNAHARGVQVLRAASAALAAAKASTGLPQRGRFEIRVYPTVAMFRDATGEPGWVAASTRGSVIHLQPPEVLNRTHASAPANATTAPAEAPASTTTAPAGNSGGTEAVLRHELTHLLIESAAAPGTPLWFREGLALYLSGPVNRRACSGQSLTELEARIRSRASRAAVQSAYASAAASVEMLIRRHGKAEVIGWLSSGPPAGVAGELPVCGPAATLGEHDLAQDAV
jgi:stage II sporulation protein D